MNNDILDLVSCEDVSVTLNIMGKKGGKAVKTGVKFYVRDLNNADTKKELKRLRNTYLGKRINAKEHMSDEDMGFMVSAASTEPTDDMLAHCVTGWDWGGKTLGNIDLSFNYKNVLNVFGIAPWIRHQVLAKAIEVTDFTTA